MLDRIRNEKIRSTAKVGEISEKEMKNMWAREQWGWRCRGKEEEDQSGGRWTTSGTTCRRENCLGMKCETELNGGVS